MEIIAKDFSHGARYQQHLAGMAAMHDVMMRQAAQQNGADDGAMRGLQASMMSLQRSVDRATEAMGGGYPRAHRAQGPTPTQHYRQAPTASYK